MISGFELTPQAINDIDHIWNYIASDSPDAADRVEAEIVTTCRRLTKHPLIGTRRQDITRLTVRFRALPKFPQITSSYIARTRPRYR